MSTFEDLQAKWKAEEEYLKNRPLRRLWRSSIRPFLYNLPDMPRDAYRALKRGFQRAYRGWADEDVWHLSSYLAKITKESVKYLRDNHLGYPSNKEIQSEEDWNEILDKMVYSFEILEQISNGEAIYIGSKIKRKKTLLGIYRETRYRILTKEEYQEYLEGQNLYKKYFLSLWD